ncbi:hypothetical protein ACFE04_011347 [Oxalis oulophora]
MEFHSDDPKIGMEFDSEEVSYEFYKTYGLRLGFSVRGEQNISYICSRYYLAPELIFGATEYSTVVDIWSTGCVSLNYYLDRMIFHKPTPPEVVDLVSRLLQDSPNLKSSAMSTNLINTTIFYDFWD